MHQTWLPLLLLLGPAAGPPPVPAPLPARVIGNFELADSAGTRHGLNDLRDRRAVVVAVLGADCPLARLAAPRLRELSRSYAPRGVGFLAINPNRHESRADLARYDREHDLGFPLLRDVGHRVADRLGAERTPEVFVLDAGRRVRYRGRIDDQNEVGLQRPRVDRQDLAEALEDVLAGRPVRVPVTVAPGCPIRRNSPAPRADGVTWSRDVAGIFQARCQVCHRPGEAGPFSLLGYADAEGWAPAIREVVAARRMPPWGASPRFGHFANDPGLTENERRTILAWIDGDCPRGEPAHEPPPRVFPSGWGIGEPDLVLSMPRPYSVPSEGVIEYQYFAVDPGFREDRWVTAVEVRPGNKRVVHHCNVFLQPPGRTDPTDLTEAGRLGSFCLTAHAPGTPPLVLRDGRAKRIPAGWKVVFVMHYQPVGSAETDRTSVGLKFADAAGVRQEVATKLMFDPGLEIPPGEAHHAVGQTWAVNRDVLLLALMPHLHLRGRAFRYELIHPDGTEEVLLDVPRWDFAWQFRYDLKEPLRVVAGSRLRCSAVYDNSAGNKANPDPTATVRTGTQSWEEMFNGYFDCCLADEDLTRPPTWGEHLGPLAAGLFRPGVALLACLAGGLYLGRRRVARWLQEGGGGLVSSWA